MPIKIRSNSKLRRDLGDAGTRLLEYGLGAITRILPHTEDLGWTIGERHPTSITWASTDRRQLVLNVEVAVGVGYAVTGIVQRRTIPAGVGRISRTLDMRERDICAKIIERLSQVL